MEQARDNPSMAIGESQEQKGVSSRSTERQNESPLRYIDGHLSSQNAESEPTFQKCKGRVVFRGDIVKEDFGTYAVFIEEGSSASQMTAGKVNGCHCKTTRLMDKQLTPFQHTPR